MAAFTVQALSATAKMTVHHVQGLEALIAFFQERCFDAGLQRLKPSMFGDLGGAPHSLQVAVHASKFCNGGQRPGRPADQTSTADVCFCKKNVDGVLCLPLAVLQVSLGWP